MTPLISIIIPTTGRPQFLPRAVNSALARMDSKDVEVIIIPNGPDETWQESLRKFSNHRSVRVIRIMETNANIARNAGLTEARGELIRFLDDDDYLIPEGAIKQYQIIQSSNVDMISGSIMLIDENGKCFDIWHQPDIDDLCAAVLGPWRKCQPSAHVYRRISLGNNLWSPETNVRQDFKWLFDLCVSHELQWIKINDVVGVWQHHWGQQVSSSKSFNDIRKLTVPMLMRAYDQLKTDGRLNDIRRTAITQGLWSCVHTAFFLEPHFWFKVACQVREIIPSARPAQALYNFPILRHINPMIIVWLMSPVKCFFYQIQQVLKKLHIRHSW